LNRTRHFLQVPWPPQVESIAMTFQQAAAGRVEKGYPQWHPHRAVIEPEVDPLAHESRPCTGIAWVGSAAFAAR
jgi:hypothetical protein